MTHKLKQDDPDIAFAKTILDKGWRQGAIFDPCGIVENIQLTDSELLVLCTQSCTVVSSRFATDPIVEAMVVKLLPKYNPRAFEATGKNQRKLHIEVIGSSEFKCIECDINRRFFLDRHHLLNINPLEEFEIGVEGSTKLAGWLGRSYTRIALPNLLARMLLENHAPWVKIDLNGPLLLRESARVESSLTAGGEIRMDPLKTHSRSIS